MVLNNCQHVWSSTNDGIETILMICTRAAIVYFNNSFNNSFNNITNENISNLTQPSPSIYTYPTSTSDMLIDFNDTFFSPSPYTPSPYTQSLYTPSSYTPSSSSYTPSSYTPSASQYTPSTYTSSPSTIIREPSLSISQNSPSKSIVDIVIDTIQNTNFSSNISLYNHTDTQVIEDLYDPTVIFSIIIPLWFIFSTFVAILYLKKRKRNPVLPCNTNYKKKDLFTRPRDYFLEIIPNKAIPDIEKPAPPIPPRPKLLMLKESLEDEEEDVEVVNVAYGITEKKNGD